MCSAGRAVISASAVSISKISPVVTTIGKKQPFQEQSSGLSIEKSGLIKGRYLAYTKQWDEATKLYESLWNLDPTTTTYGLLLSKSQEEGNRLVKRF